MPTQRTKTRLYTPASGVAIGSSAGSRNRGPRPLGAPDRGHDLFSLQDAKNQDSEKKPKSAQRRPCLLTAFIFLFPNTLTDSSDEELCNKLWLRSLATNRPIQMTSPMSR